MTPLETQLTADNERLRNENLRLQSKLDSTLAAVRQVHNYAQNTTCKALGVISFLEGTEGRKS